jgi:G6PDH family F420-dependent oxidoreductase
MLGGLSQLPIHLATLVTCPIFRTHPAHIAHAAATVSLMCEGRFSLGVGTGERLNEHVHGDHWPAFDVRCARLREAITLMRLLWHGDLTTWHGEHFVVENLKLYDAPVPAPPILVAADGPKSVQIAADLGDGLIVTDPDRDLIDTFRASGGGEKPVVSMLRVAAHEGEVEAAHILDKEWPVGALPGSAKVELAPPTHFEHLADMLPPRHDGVVLGLDPASHRAALEAYAGAGVDLVYNHQVGDHHDAFFDLYWGSGALAAEAREGVQEPV